MLKSHVLVLSFHFRFSLKADCYLDLFSFHFWLLPRRLTQSTSKKRKTMARIDAKRSGITKNNPKRVLCGLKSPTLGFSGRYRDISSFSFSADSHFYLSPTASSSCLTHNTQAGHTERFRKTRSTVRQITTELQADMRRQVHVHSGMPCKFNHYMHVCLARNLKHCHIVAMGMTLLQLPNSLSST